ncbi:MAG: ABC-type Zn uptake system ZnuABC Zn-binding protein ZnuA [Saprospiraceae bacterium]|jgi:ABC-type Zn uptake system ZnuABC Zn-binding protein ZnuA
MKTTFLTFLFLLCLYTGYSQDKPKVVATASMIWDMAQNIGGDYFDIQCIVPIGGDPHIYEPTPGDVKKVTAAQLVLKNGLTFEGWLDELIENSGTKAKTVRVTEGITPIQSSVYHNASDPHAWMSVNNGYKYIENIKNAFIELLPQHKEIFESNYESYLLQLKDLDAYILAKIKSIPEGKRILITSHDAFQYFGRHYGIRLEAILGISTDAQAQTSDVIRINNVIRDSKVPAVFIESTINPKLLEQLAKDNHIVIGGKLFADSIGEKDSEAPTYIDMMRHNTDTIVAGLLQQNNSEESTKGDQNPLSGYWLYGLIIILFIGGFWLVVVKLNKN